MSSKTGRVVIATVAIAAAGVSSPIGAAIGAAAADYAIQKLEKRGQKKK